MIRTKLNKATAQQMLEQIALLSFVPYKCFGVFLIFKGYADFQTNR